MISSNSSAEEIGGTVPETATPDPAPRPSRRSFTAAYKLAIVAQYEAAPHGEKSAVLRREGLYHSHTKGMGPRPRRRGTRRARRRTQVLDWFEGVGQGR